MREDEAEHHLHELAGPGAYAADEARALWTASHQDLRHVHTSPGIPELTDLPPEAWDHLLQIHQHESLALLVADFTWSVRLVEIDPLLSVAIDVFVARVEEWTRRLSGGDPCTLLDACLPRKAAPFLIMTGPSLAFAVHSDLGASWAHDVRKGPLPSILKPPLPVRVVEIAGSYYLMDGYHRALALRRLGHTHIPALVLHDCHWSFLRHTPRRRMFQPAPFASPNPPCVGHFLTPAAVETRAAPCVRVMTIRVESFIAPIADIWTGNTTP
jgi:hypothetical protein